MTRARQSASGAGRIGRNLHELGGGTSPASRAAVATAAATCDEAALPPAELRILCVEDHADTCEMIRELLLLEGYAVECATGGSMGLKRLSEERFDLVVTDYALPDRTGIDMLKEARQNGWLNGTPQVLFTAHPEPERLDGVTLVKKPLAVDAFLQTIHELLEPMRAAAVERARRIRCESVRAPSAMNDSPAKPRVDLTLYVSAASLASMRALRALEQLLLQYDPDEVRLRVVDLAKDPSGADEDDRIVFTPTLVQRYPAPRIRVLGNLTNTQVVVDMLEAAGCHRKRPSS